MCDDTLRLEKKNSLKKAPNTMEEEGVKARSKKKGKILFTKGSSTGLESILNKQFSSIKIQPKKNKHNTHDSIPHLDMTQIVAYNQPP